MGRNLACERNKEQPHDLEECGDPTKYLQGAFMMREAAEGAETTERTNERKNDERTTVTTQ
jgi:hypothetical protein